MTRVSSKAASKCQDITLNGSATVVTDFFGYAVCNVLYQRGVYSSKNFCTIKKYDSSFVVFKNEALSNYLQGIITQLQAWIVAGKARKVALVIKNKKTREATERWQFNLQVRAVVTDEKGELFKPQDEKTIQYELQTIIHQTTTSVAFLPDLEDQCTFNILIFATSDTKYSKDWVKTNPQFVSGNVDQIPLSPFSTNFYSVQSQVEFRAT